MSEGESSEKFSYNDITETDEEESTQGNVTIQTFKRAIADMHK